MKRPIQPTDIQRLAYVIYTDAKNQGFPDDPEGNWFKAERILQRRRSWLWWQLKWYFKRHAAAISAAVAIAALLLNISTTSWIVHTNERSIDLSNRPYVSVNMEQPIRRPRANMTFYGNDITLGNGGKTAAANVATGYYITTDADRVNQNGAEWFDRHLGGFGAVSFIAPGATEIEPGLRDLSPAANYYYFEALTTYEGLPQNRTYWTHIKKAFFLDRNSWQLYPVFSYGEWDRNRNFTPPSISTTDEVVALLQRINQRRLSADRPTPNVVARPTGDIAPELLHQPAELVR